MSTADVIIIDTDAERAAAVAARARSDAWDTSILTSVESARAVIGARPVTLAVIDSSLWHRHDLASWISAEHPALPVVVLTDRDAAPDGIVEQLQLGAMSFVPRDSDSRRLVETIGTIIGLSRRNPYREGVRPYLRAGEVELHVGSDPSVVPVVVGYLQRILEDYGLTSAREQTRVGVAVSEALANAMIHGNLEVGSEMRTDQPDLYYRLVDERSRMEPYKDRNVHVIMRFSQSSATFVIRDQGRGFDRGAVADPTDPANIMLASGRGILLMRAYCDAVSWNDSGNEITLVKVLKP
jgi:anti-sigma regulatory factor (Ser/Thr protein kinase)